MCLCELIYLWSINLLISKISAKKDQRMLSLYCEALKMFENGKKKEG